MLHSQHVNEIRDIQSANVEEMRKGNNLHYARCCILGKPYAEALVEMGITWDNAMDTIRDIRRAREGQTKVWRAFNRAVQNHSGPKDDTEFDTWVHASSKEVMRQTEEIMKRQSHLDRYEAYARAKKMMPKTWTDRGRVVEVAQLTVSRTLMIGRFPGGAARCRGARAGSPPGGVRSEAPVLVEHRDGSRGKDTSNAEEFDLDDGKFVGEESDSIIPELRDHQVAALRHRHGKRVVEVGLGAAVWFVHGDGAHGSYLQV